MLVEKVEHFRDRSSDLALNLIVLQITLEYPVVVHPGEANDGQFVLEIGKKQQTYMAEHFTI